MRATPELRPVAIRCSGVQKTFGVGPTRTVAVNGADLDVFAGELTLLVGPSGCGKTTLVSIMAGILSPDAGEVEVFGTRLDTLRSTSAARFRATNVGFILQQFNLLPALTALENVVVPMLVQRVGQNEAYDRAANLLDDLDLRSHGMKYPSELSMGQQQRVAIARALIHEPRLVVCDEPTAALDAASGLATIQMLRDVALRKDRAVIVVTHDTRILPFADRIACMNDGRISHIETATSREAA